MTRRQHIWAGVLVAGVCVLGLLVAGAILRLQRTAPGPADTLDVVSAVWTQKSPPTAEVVFRLRRADGRPASQSHTVGTAEGQPPYIDEDLKHNWSSSPPTYHYSVTFKRQPRDPLVIQVTAHSDELMVAKPRGAATVVAPSRDLFTRQIVVPPPAPE